MSKYSQACLGLVVVVLVGLFREGAHERALVKQKEACEAKVTEAEEFWPGKPMNFANLRGENYRVAAVFLIKENPYRLGVVVDPRGNHIFVSSLPGQFQGGEEFIFVSTKDGGYRTPLVKK